MRQRREVDRVQVLASPGNEWTARIESALVDNLTLIYADERTHRAVVFGIADVGPGDRLRVTEVLVILPLCCCGEEICI
ncbi:MAG: hypothetical protein R3190_12160 [Thermoanaerobaculia bacterium]|nr:hypothetical protein [Thermoanaerobaculia bacterium]